jgi:hypothetical protein
MNPFYADDLECPGNAGVIYRSSLWKNPRAKTDVGRPGGIHVPMVPGWAQLPDVLSVLHHLPARLSFGIDWLKREVTNEPAPGSRLAFTGCSRRWRSTQTEIRREAFHAGQRARCCHGAGRPGDVGVPVHHGASFVWAAFQELQERTVIPYTSAPPFGS